MQLFIDTKTQRLWEFEDSDKIVIDPKTGASKAFGAAGNPLPLTPATLQPYTPPTLTTAQKLSAAKSANAAAILIAASQAQDAPLTLTTAGKVTATFAMDAIARGFYMGAYILYVVQGKPLPSGFAFDDQDGVAVPMTLADLEAFATAFDTQVYGAISKKASLLAQNAAATTQTAVKAITW